MREEKNHSKIITRDIELHILEIPKIKEDELLKEELAYLSGDPGFQRLVEARAGFLKDQKALEERGKKEITELTKEEIEKFKK